MLNQQEKINTQREFEENIELLGYSLEKIADDLNWDLKKLKKVINLKPDDIIEPWDLRDYLLKELATNNIKPVEFSKLKGDRSDYWFLK